MIIKLSTCSPSWNFTLQTPNSYGRWDGVQFFVDRDCPQADVWVVYEAIYSTMTTLCPPSRTLFITGEPPLDMKRYPEKFANQFARVLTSYSIPHKGRIAWQQALPWHYGRNLDTNGNESFVENYNSLMQTDPFPNKERQISTVCSNKNKLPAHKKRDEFVTFLQRSSIDGLDVFGRGRARQVACKRDAIAPYKYHIVLENSVFPDYWTEKLSDAYLGGAYPFYWGCPNLEKYFPGGSFTHINIDRPEEALRTIRETMARNAYEESIPLLRRARELVLNRYNLFPTILSLFRDLPEAETPVPVTIRPAECFSLRGRIRQVRWRIGKFLGKTGPGR